MYKYFYGGKMSSIQRRTLTAKKKIDVKGLALR